MHFQSIGNDADHRDQRNLRLLKHTKCVETHPSEVALLFKVPLCNKIGFYAPTRI